MKLFFTQWDYGRKAGQFITKDGRVIFIGGPGSGGGGIGSSGGGISEIDPETGIHERDGGIPFEAGNHASRAQAIQKAGWKLDPNYEGIEQYTLVSKTRNTRYDRAVRLRGFSSNVGIEIFDVQDGKIIPATRRTVWHKNSTAIPTKIDVISWVGNGLLDKYVP